MRLELCTSCRINPTKFRCNLCKKGYCEKCMPNNVLLCPSCLRMDKNKGSNFKIY